MSIGDKDTLLFKGRRRILSGRLESLGLFNDNVLKAIGAVPRHLFVQKGLEDQAYKDVPVAIGAGQTISQPSTVALQTQLLELKAGDRILEIGTGCGYQSAVLFYLGAEVYSMKSSSPRLQEILPRRSIYSLTRSIRPGQPHRLSAERYTSIWATGLPAWKQKRRSTGSSSPAEPRKFPRLFSSS